jgi:phage/plasmid-associated DNA primase
VDLRTGELRASRPEDLLTAVCAVPYRKCDSPLLDQYLETFIPDREQQNLLFGILGTALLGGNDTRMFPIILGETTSGKSQLISAFDAHLR